MFYIGGNVIQDFTKKNEWKNQKSFC
jgi:hypothetical protein